MEQVKRICRELYETQLLVFSANSAFFLFLSLFPAMGLLLGLMGQLALPQSEFFDVFQHLVPEALEPFFHGVIRELGSGTAPSVSFAVILALWSSSRGVYCLLLGLDNIAKTKIRGGILTIRAVSILYTVALLAGILLTFGFYSLGRWVLSLFVMGNSPFAGAVRFLVETRAGICLIFLSLLFLFIFTTFPHKHLTFSQALPGSLFAAAGWVQFTWLYSFWATKFSGYSKIYGSVAILALTMLWLYCCLAIVLFGAFLNEELKDRIKQKKS